MEQFLFLLFGVLGGVGYSIFLANKRTDEHQKKLEQLSTENDNKNKNLEDSIKNINSDTNKSLEDIEKEKQRETNVKDILDFFNKSK